jgi:integrase
MLSGLRALTALVGPGIRPEDFPWTQLRREHCAAIRSKLLDKAPATARHRLTALKGILKEAWRQNLMDTEAYQRAVDLDPIRGSRLTHGRLLDSGEVARMFGVLGRFKSPIRERNQALLSIAVHCGLRRFELAEVQREGIVGATLSVVGKGNKEREVPLNAAARADLEAWLRFRGNTPGPLFKPVRNGKLVDHAMSVSGVDGCLRELATEAKVEDFSPHDTRCTFITRLLETGTELGTVQKLAGHSDPATTMLYDRRGRRQAVEAVERLGIAIASPAEVLRAATIAAIEAERQYREAQAGPKPPERPGYIPYATRIHSRLGGVAYAWHYRKEKKP